MKKYSHCRYTRSPLGTCHGLFITALRLSEPSRLRNHAMGDGDYSFPGRMSVPLVDMCLRFSVCQHARPCIVRGCYKSNVQTQFQPCALQMKCAFTSTCIEYVLAFLFWMLFLIPGLHILTRTTKNTHEPRQVMILGFFKAYDYANENAPIILTA